MVALSTLISFGCCDNGKFDVEMSNHMPLQQLDSVALSFWQQRPKPTIQTLNQSLLKKISIKMHGFFSFFAQTLSYHSQSHTSQHRRRSFHQHTGYIARVCARALSNMRPSAVYHSYYKFTFSQLWIQQVFDRGTFEYFATFLRKVSVAIWLFCWQTCNGKFIMHNTSYLTLSIRIHDNIQNPQVYPLSRSPTNTIIFQPIHRIDSAS